MSHRHEITFEQYHKLEPHLPGRIGSHGGVARGNLNFLNAAVYLSRIGIPWRDLHERYGYPSHECHVDL